MSLVNPLPYIEKAHRGKTALAAFNVHNLETIQGVIEGAARENTPVMIATTPGTIRHAGVKTIVCMVSTTAENYDIPVALHLDHCSSYEMVIKAINSGYTSVMIDGSEFSYKKNVALVREVVKVARVMGIPVEAELGRIGGTEDEKTVDEEKEALTVPDEAKRFVEETGIDTLAVAIGTAHGVYKGEPELDFARLTSIENKVDLPLVLHGASGVPDEKVKKAISRGISKVNIATELKIPFVNAVRDYLEQNPGANDPRQYLSAGREALQNAVREKIRLCGVHKLS